MGKQKATLLGAMLMVALTSGCASYRTSSNIETKTPASLAADTKVIISEDSLPNKKYTAVGPIEVSIKKLTAFHKNPTREQANEALSEKARVIGADAVVNVTYKSGIGFTTWGYMDAKGMGVKLAE
ncbi:hypothetical protein [Pseudogulbenkiania sp. MAI-1]|uniref:hypothetical protein n=1 Tax=Pseudogulbenkiania sp. MAI-1 TaxID=990370 RepID=UPI00045E80E1|nr:hypothetical protein [Pseudogulbenkiania sp. MAI-1]